MADLMRFYTDPYASVRRMASIYGDLPRQQFDVARQQYEVERQRAAAEEQKRQFDVTSGQQQQQIDLQQKRDEEASVSRHLQNTQALLKLAGPRAAQAYWNSHVPDQPIQVQPVGGPGGGKGKFFQIVEADGTISTITLGKDGQWTGYDQTKYQSDPQYRAQINARMGLKASPPAGPTIRTEEGIREGEPFSTTTTTYPPGVTPPPAPPVQTPPPVGFKTDASGQPGVVAPPRPQGIQPFNRGVPAPPPPQPPVVPMY